MQLTKVPAGVQVIGSQFNQLVDAVNTLLSLTAVGAEVRWVPNPVICVTATQSTSGGLTPTSGFVTIASSGQTYNTVTDAPSGLQYDMPIGKVVYNRDGTSYKLEQLIATVKEYVDAQGRAVKDITNVRYEEIAQTDKECCT